MNQKINQKLLVSGADFFANDFKINPYYDDNQINIKKAQQEHNEIISCFKKAGIEIIQCTPPKNCQDGVYTANWSIVKGKQAIMSRLPKARQAEEPYAQKILQGLGYETFLPPEGHLFSGQGDSLICGNYLFAGSGYRSNPESQQFVAQKFNLELIQLHTIPKLNPDGTQYINPVTHHADSFFYDLDLALSIISPNCIAYCPEAFDQTSKEKLANLPIDKIIVDYQEAVDGFACNLVSTGEFVIMSNKAPKLQKALELRGLKCLTPDVTELKKGGGYIRCISLAI